MNSTSRGCRLVRIAARSPGRSTQGPDVCRSPTPSSCGEDVGERGLAEAGRPEDQHVVRRASRARATTPLEDVSSCCLTCDWPTLVDPGAWGRIARSIASSSRPPPDRVTLARLVNAVSLALGGCALGARALRAAGRRGDVDALEATAWPRARLVAERDQRRERLACGLARLPAAGVAPPGRPSATAAESSSRNPLGGLDDRPPGILSAAIVRLRAVRPSRTGAGRPRARSPGPMPLTSSACGAASLSSRWRIRGETARPRARPGG